MGRPRIFVCLILLCICFALSQICSFAYTDLPENWPWKGVTLTNVNSEPKDISVLKRRLNLNAVRLTLNPRLLAKHRKISVGEAWEMSLTWANDMLTACKEAGVVGIISLSHLPIDPNLGINQTSPEFWQNPIYAEQTIQLVGELARRVSRHGNELGGFDILNEPLVRIAGVGKVPKQWPELRNRIISKVRKYTDAWIVVATGPGGSPGGYNKFSPILRDKLIYGAHMYLPHHFTHQGLKGRNKGFSYPGAIGGKFWDKAALTTALAPLRKFQVENRVLIWIGEFSAVRWANGGEEYLEDLAEIFNEYEWGWSYHQYGGYHGWNPDYSNKFSSDQRSDWEQEFVGVDSPRWKKLFSIFGKIEHKTSP